MFRRMFLLSCLALVAGCGGSQPKLSGKSKQMFDRISTQVNNKSRKRMEQLTEQLKDAHENKQVTDDQFAVLDAICRKTADGRWDEAEELINSLSEAQKTAE